MKEYRKSHSKNVLEITRNNELKNVEIDVITNFIKDKVESSSDEEIYTDDDGDSEENKVIGFRENVSDHQQNVSSVYWAFIEN